MSQPSLDPLPRLVHAERVWVVLHVFGVGLDLVLRREVRQVAGEGSQAEPNGQQLRCEHACSLRLMAPPSRSPHAGAWEAKGPIGLASVSVRAIALATV